MSQSTIQDQLRAAIAARKDSLIALRKRIIDLVEPIPVGVRLACADGDSELCRVVKIWDRGNSEGACGDRRNHSEWGVMAEGRLVCASEPDDKSLYFEDRGDDWGDQDEPLKWLSGKLTREIAVQLPQAIERYMKECEAERAANESTLNTEVRG